MSSLALRIYVLVFCVAFVPAGCSRSTRRKPAPPPKPQVKHAPPTPIDNKAAELGTPIWNPRWDRIVEQALPPVLLSRQVPRDVRRFCPRFYRMSDRNKRAFWAYFFQALAGAEAGLNPSAMARHTEPKLARREKVPATRVRTEGLLQLTYADERRYGCPFDEKADRRLKVDDPARTILQPKNNLICGVKILTHQLIDRHKPLLSPSSYWATLRPGTSGYRIFDRQMANPPAACGLHRTHHRPATSSRSEAVQ